MTPERRIPVDQTERDRVERQLDQTLFVEAGAGTGKTTALVNRIVNLVLGQESSPVRLSKIAAITFTEAAAAELRDRIRTTFEERRLDARTNGDAVIEQRCSDALIDADLAAISTLHAFAQRLLTERSIEVGIPPRVEVVDEVQSLLAFEDRWSQFVDELFADDEVVEFIVRAAILGVKIADRSSPLRVIAKIFDDNWDRLLAQNHVPAPMTIDWSALGAAARSVVVSVDHCVDHADNLMKSIGRARPHLDVFLTGTSDVDRLRALMRLKSTKWARGNKTCWSDVEIPREAVASVNAATEALYDRVADNTLQMLADRIGSFTLETAEQRRREGQLEFHDLLVLARRLLRVSSDARADLSSRYHVILLDEFQDTDPIQIELALLLAGETAGEFDGDWDTLDASPGRLFMVGDPKQSIYRFRRADIELFHDVQRKFSDGVVTLRQNFRTVEPIIKLVNEFFAVQMEDGIQGQATYSPLEAIRGASDLDHRPLIFGGPIEESAAEIRRVEAADVAQIVADIAESPSSWPVFDRKTSAWRDARMSDITILLPTRTSLGALTEALDEQSLPYRADTGSLVYESQDVRDILTVLRAIDDPTDQIALVAALRSPLYACGDDDLYRWTRAGGGFELDAVIPHGFEGSPVAAAIEHLRELSALRWWTEPSQMMMRVIEDRGAFVLATTGRRPRDTWRRLRYVVDQARAFAEAGGGDLRAYLDWTSLQGLDGSKAHEPMLPEIDDDAIQIMTIHGAKGLEFPITIVTGLTTRIGAARTGPDVRFGPSGTSPSVSLKKSLRTADFEARNDLEEQMDRPEKTRLLYVAMTRARDHLIVSGHHPVKTKASDGTTTPVDCHGLAVHTFATEQAGEAVRWFDPSETQQSLPLAAPLRTPVFDTSFSEADWQAERSALLSQASMPNVVSATAIAKDLSGAANLDEVESDEDETGDALVDETDGPRVYRRGRAGTAIGRAVHGVLQHVDLTDPQPATIAELARSQAWAESVPDHVDTIHDAALSALTAPIVASCRTARHWKELYVAAPVGALTIEGYVDLLVESSEGLVIVDYKTDAVRSDSEIDEKLDTYGRQGAAYACALAKSTGKAIAAVEFVFARSDGVTVRSIENLPAAMAEIEKWASETVPAG